MFTFIEISRRRSHCLQERSSGKTKQATDQYKFSQSCVKTLYLKRIIQVNKKAKTKTAM